MAIANAKCALNHVLQFINLFVVLTIKRTEMHVRWHKLVSHVNQDQVKLVGLIIFDVLGSYSNAFSILQWWSLLVMANVHVSIVSVGLGA